MAQAAERVYSCPQCGKKVSAVSPLAGAVCLSCNGVSSWQPIMEDIANRMRQQSSNLGAMQIAMQTLQQKGIYAKFMMLYGHQLQSIISNMSSTAPISTADHSSNATTTTYSKANESTSTYDTDESDKKQYESQSKTTKQSNDRVLSAIKERAKDRSSGTCGTAVRMAIQASGKEWQQPPKRNINGQMSVCAKDFGPSLKAAGYAKAIGIGADENAEQFEEHLKAGDVLVFDGVGNAHPYGHVQVYVGAYETVKHGKKVNIKYISDFKQNTMIPWRDGKHNGIAVYRLK